MGLGGRVGLCIRRMEHEIHVPRLVVILIAEI
jgi:hypothetical protein